MSTSTASKMGIKAGMRAIILNGHPNEIESINLPAISLNSVLSGDFDYIHLFVMSQIEFNQELKKVKISIKQKGMLWVSWPKAGKLGTDLNIKNIIKIGYEHGLVESKCLSINETWSALKFTHPKEGKVYNNSYGKLSEPGHGSHV
jgi:hypothetical protein